MALSLGVNKGSRLNVGKNQIEVLDILNPVLIEISVDGGEGVLVSDAERVKVLPDVFVFAGTNSRGVGYRLVFDAPRNVKISREPEEVAA